MFQDASNKERIQEAVHTIKRIEREKTQRLINPAKIQWAEENEKYTRFFFNRLKQGTMESNIISLEKDDKQMSGPEVKTEIHIFYSKLYEHKHCQPKNNSKIGDP